LRQRELTMTRVKRAKWLHNHEHTVAQVAEKMRISEATAQVYITQPKPRPRKFRAYCPECRDFTIRPDDDRCPECGALRDHSFDIVEVEADE